MPAPREERPGKAPVHSKGKLDLICVLVVARHKTSGGMEGGLPAIEIPRRTGESGPLGVDNSGWRPPGTRPP